MPATIHLASNSPLVHILLPFALAFIFCWVLIRSAHGVQLGLDQTSGEPQKLHTRPTPRIGGLAILVALTATTFVGSADSAHLLQLLTLSGAPLLAAGAWEDLRRHLSPTIRAIAGLVSALLAALVCHALIPRVGIGWVDVMLDTLPGLSLALSVIAIGSMPHALNMIDGFNGLAAGYSLMVLAAIGLIAHQVGDPAITSCALMIGSAVAGFLLWNWPSGRIFLGDTGAYGLGFALAVLAVLLVARHPQVSAWFVLLLLLYPTWELLFSLLRRKLVHRQPGMRPDRTHLHHLIHDALCSSGIASFCTPDNPLRCNAMTSPILLLLAALTIVPAVLWWRVDDRALLQGIGLTFIILYSVLHRSLQSLSRMKST